MNQGRDYAKGQKLGRAEEEVEGNRGEHDIGLWFSSHSATSRRDNRRDHQGPLMARESPS